MSEERKTIQILDKTHQLLKDASEKKNMKIIDIIAYLVDLMDKYNLLNDQWINELRDEIQAEMKESLSDDKFARVVELENRRATNRAKLMVWQEYLKVIPEDSKRAFLEEMLMINQGKGGIDFLDSLTQYSMVKVNGESRPMRTTGDGLPAWNNPLEIVQCEKGFHVKRSFCHCPLWRTCKIRAVEYEQFQIEDQIRKEELHKERLKLMRG